MERGSSRRSGAGDRDQRFDPSGGQGNRHDDRERPSGDAVGPGGVLGEVARTVLVVGGIGLVVAAVWLASTERVLALGPGPDRTAVEPWASSYRAAVAAAGAVAGGAVAAVGATVPGEGPAPLVPDPGLGTVGRRRVVAGVLVAVPAVLELATAASAMRMQVDPAVSALLTVAVPTVALAAGLVLAGLSAGRSRRLAVAPVDRTVRRLGDLRDRIRSSLADDPSGWGWTLVVAGCYAVLLGGVVILDRPRAPYLLAEAILGLLFSTLLVAVGLVTVYSGAFRILDRLPPVSAADWSPAANGLWLTGLAVAAAAALPGTITSGLLFLGFERRAGTVQLVVTLGLAAYGFGVWVALSGLGIRGVELLAAGGRRAVERLR